MVACSVIRIADQQDGISGLVRAKKRERFMDRVPQRNASTQWRRAFNHFIDGGGAHLELRRLDGPRALTPLLGRQSELERLHASWRMTRAGDARLVVISAEAGMGKSRLVREFRHQLMESGVKVLECRCRADASASQLNSREWKPLRSPSRTRNAIGTARIGKS